MGKRAPVLELPARKNKALLVRWNALLVLDLDLDHFDCDARLYLEGDGLAQQPSVLQPSVLQSVLR